MTSAIPPSRIAQLDGLRGVAILLVIFHNQTPKYPTLHMGRLFADGWMGVDLFFVLSGFLITGILLDAKDSPRYFENFYARRCLRIWPLYYAVLLFMFVGIPLVRQSEAHVIFERSSPWWSYPLFLQNFLVAAPLSATGPLGVTWSLAIEEQFYIVWPLVVRYGSAAQLRRLALAVICVSPVLRWYLASRGVDLYPNVFCRLDGLMAGSFLAVMTRRQDFVPADHANWAWALLAIAAPAAILAEAMHARWIAFSFTAVASAALVYVSLFAAPRWLSRALTNRLIVFTGTISYGLYLLHKIPFDLAQAFRLDRRPLLAFPAGLVACYALATASWFVLEQPFLAFKRRFGTQPPARF